MDYFRRIRDNAMFRPPALMRLEDIKELNKKYGDPIVLPGYGILYRYGEEQPGPIIFYLHGNADDVIRNANMLHEMSVKYECPVYAPEYPGYGLLINRQVGLERTRKYVYEAYAHTREKFPGRKFIIYGRSLGSGLAGQLIRKAKSDGLVLESAMSDAFHVVGIPYYTPFNCLHTSAALRGYENQVLLIHGTADQVINYEENFNQNFEACVDPVGCTLENEGHNTINIIDDERVSKPLSEYIYNVQHG